MALFKDRLKKLINSLFTRYERMQESSVSLSPTNTLKFSHIMLWTTFVFFIIFLIWAKFAALEVVTVAEATVIPFGHVQVIQNMEGGIITKMMVHEGDIVNKGQILVYLDPTRFVSNLHETEARVVTLQMKIARLTAEVKNLPFEITPELWRQFPTEAQNEESLYVSRQNQLKTLRDDYALAQQELNMTAPLVKEGAAADVDVLHLQRDVYNFKNQIDDFYSHDYTDLEAAKSDLATYSATLSAIKDRITRTTIRSPVRGVVKQIKLPTTEGVVLPGAEIMSVVPLEDTLIIEARVKPSDIGFIHRGQSATVKITAYDYAIYGGLTGKVDEVGADTITNEKGESYYLVRVKTNKNYLGSPDSPLYIIPGMTATVSILTGKKTVLDYLLSPIFQAKENALRER